MAVTKEISFDVEVKAKEGKGKRRIIARFHKTIKLNQSERTSDFNHQQDEIKVVKVICNKDGYNRVKNIQNRSTQVEGKVMYSKEEYPEDVKVLVREVAEKKAAAVFVVTDPGIVVDIPVFVVKRGLLNDMESARAVEVSFKCVDFLPFEESESEDSGFDLDDFSVKSSEAKVPPRGDHDAGFEVNKILESSAMHSQVSNSVQAPFKEHLLNYANPEACLSPTSNARVGSGVAPSDTALVRKRREISFQIDGHCQGQDLPPIFHLKTILPWSVSIDRFHRTDLKLVMATCQRSRRAVTGIANWKHVKGTVVYSRETEVKDVRVIVESLEMHGALAVFVTCDPGVSSNIPVFVLTPSQFNTLVQLHCQNLRVNLSPVGNAEELYDCGEDKQFDMSNEDMTGVGCVNEALMDTFDDGRTENSNIQHFSITIRCFGPSGKYASINTVQIAMVLSNAACDDYHCQNVMMLEAQWSQQYQYLMNRSEVKGRVIFSKSQEERIVRSIAREGGKNDAVALFAGVMPKDCCEIPVFVLQEAQLREIMRYSSLSVDIEPLREHPLEGRVNGDVTKEDRKRKKNRKRQNRKKSKSGHQNNESMKESSFFAKGANMVMNGMKKLIPSNYTPIMKSHLEKILVRRCDWSTEDGLVSYSEAMGIIQRALGVSNHAHEELRQISIELIEHIEQNFHKVDILVLGYATYLLLWCEKIEKNSEFEELRSHVAQAVLCLEMDPNSAKFCDAVNIFGDQFRAYTCHNVQCYASSCFQRMRKGNRGGKLELKNDFLLKLVWVVVHHCGSRLDWQELIPLIDPSEFPTSEDCKLAQILGVIPFQTLGLNIQTTFDGFYNVLDEMRMASGVPVVVLFEREDQFLIPLLKSPFNLQNVSRSLDQFRFHDPDDNLRFRIDGWKKQVVSKIVAENAGRNLSSLQQILESIDVEHSYYGLFRQEIIKLCSKILQPRSHYQPSYQYYYQSYSQPYYQPLVPSIRDLRNALGKSPLGNLLASKDLLDPMKHYIHTSLKKPKYVNSNEDKIALVEDVYSSLVRVQDVDPNVISSFLSESLGCIMQACRLDFFRLVAEKRDFFSAAPDEDLVTIASLVWKGFKVAGDEKILTKLPLSDADGGAMAKIRIELYNILCTSFVCIEKWTDFYNRTESDANETLKTILNQVFLHVLQKWNPTELHKIVRLSPGSIRTLSAFFSTTEHEIASSVQTLIVDTCSKWNRKYKSDSLPYNEINGILTLYSHEGWKEVECIIGMKLISDTELRDTLKRTDDLLSAIHMHTHSNDASEKEGQIEHIPILKIFSKYGCDFKLGIVGGILLEWQDFSSKVVAVKEDFIFHDIQRVADCLKDFRTNHQSEINIAQYMGGSDCRLFYNEIGFFQDWIPVSIETFLDKVTDAKRSLRSLLRCNGEDPCAMIKEAFDFLQKENRDLVREMEKLSSCPDFRVDETDMSQFRLLASLVTISSPLRVFVECCRQLNFTFTGIDESFEGLSKISEVLDLNGESSFAAKDANTIASQIVDAIALPGNRSKEVQPFIQGLVPFFKGFGYLSSSSDVWTLVREMKWFGKDGRKQFNEEYSNVTNKFLFSDSETYESNILDALDPVVRFVSFLGSLLGESSFKDFYIQTKDLDELLPSNLMATKRNIQLIQENVSNIREWFDIGVDETLAIFGRFNQVWQTGQYIIKDNELCLRYSASEKESVVLLYSRSLSGFVQQLGFVQQENQSLSSRITSLIEQYQVLTEVVGKCTHATSVGYKFNLDGYFPYSVQNQLMDTRILLDQATKELTECDLWLQRIRSSAPLSLLYWTEDLRIVYDIIMDICGDGDIEKPLNMLLPRLAVLIPDEMHQNVIDGISGVTRECLVQFKEVLDTEDCCWLSLTAQFLEAWRSQLAEARNSKSTLKSPKGGIFLHSFECDQNQKPLATLCVVQHIYKGRIPKSYEILDGMIPCTTQKMNTFLDRVKAFPDSSFTVINVQDLPGELQEQLVNFMSHTDQNNHNLHCIQLSDTILYSSPWVEQFVWNERRLRASDLEKMKSQIIDGFFIEQVAVVLGASGSGKTKWIRNEMESLQNRYDEINILSLPIHEGTNIHSLVQSLQRIPSTASSKTAIHFSFMLPLCERCDADWLKALNHFFNMFFLTRSIHDPATGETFFMGWHQYHIYVELQGVETICKRQETLSVVAKEALSVSIPILAFCSTFQIPPQSYSIDNKTRRVCTYLRALKDGTIDRKFDPRPAGKQLMFVIDKSGSMAGSQLNVAIDNALNIFDSHIRIGDVFGTLLFDHNTYVAVPLQKVTDDNISTIRNNIDESRDAGGRTSMFSALHTALMDLQELESGRESWIVCLTDGESNDAHREEFRQNLCASPLNLHVMIIGVNLHPRYQGYLRELCAKFGSMDTQGAFFASEANVGSLNNAFQSVAASIPVSQTFELDGALTEEDCWALISEYLPDFVHDNDMMRKKFWIEFLYRRVKVFDGNEHFNYNETHDHLGSSLISIMLYEASRLLSPEHNRNWKESNHEQLIYDFTTPDAPEFRFICTAPDLMSEESIDRYTSLDLPGFFIPTPEQIKTRECLDSYLSQALKVPLVPCEDGSQRLSCVDENGFVLTLDFTMKILNMHERIACHVPCIIEGETGVSKTALTLMYSILMNSSLTEEAKKHTRDAMKFVFDELLKRGLLEKNIGSNTDSLGVIRAALEDATDGTMTNITQIGNELRELLIQCCNQRSCIFEGVPDDFTSDKTSIFGLLEWFSESNLEQTFFELNVDASLDESEVRDFFKDVCKTAKKVATSGAVVVVFLDEFNTSSIMGLFKEIIVDRSFCGEPLEPNVAVVAACNPAGRQSLSAGLSRESDLAKEWASGHYQVNELPKSMACLKWNYGALNPEQEKEFVWRRIEMLNKSIPFHLVGELTEIITTSQEAIRSFAAKDIQRGLERVSPHGKNEEEAANRARSVVSLRDIQRVFTLFRFFTVDFPVTRGNGSEKIRASMLLTVAIVYYFKLDRDSRLSFLDEISKSLGNPTLKDEFLALIDQNMTAIVEQTVIPDGIALTDGLKENIFMTLVCSLSCTPLVIVGPPGSSKTLSVNILDSNTNGEESPSKFYRQLSRLSTYHYQCSKTSTSKEVASVFDKAIQRQSKVDHQKHKCLVFMDEAGLPEEEKESLKVLHYYLEGHMSSKASVAFVAITNHVLDAAKSNRCVSLLRQEPDEYEMSQVAEGVLFSSGTNSHNPKQVRFENRIIPGVEFASALCSAYKSVLSLEGYGFETFYGLRDFIYFLQYVRLACKSDDMYVTISHGVLVDALERNFNGIPSRDFKVLIDTFLQQCINREGEVICRKTIDVVRSALKPGYSSKARYTLVIDESNDDSIMRLLQSEGLIQASKRSLFKLSNMPENTEMEQLNLVSRVKFAAQQGCDTIILSQTDSVNESFYDLFNQNFRRVPNRDGEERLYANIAVGGVSRRSRVSASFRCVMHVRAADLEHAPAPFLNRFEKYRLSIEELLSYKLDRSPFLSRIVARAQKQIERFSSIISLCGFVPGQTTETVFLDLFRQAPILKRETNNIEPSDFLGNSFYDFFGTFSNDFVGIRMDKEDFDQLCMYGLRFLPMSQKDVLEEIVKKEELSNRHNIAEAFHDCLFHKPRDGLAMLIERLFEMLITKMAIVCLLQLASPEEMFKKRDFIPLDLVDEYFQQEHFSLKPFVQSVSQAQPSGPNIQKYIVHTRSNGQVMGIPTIRVDEKQPQKIEFVQTFIHPSPERVMIEHLNSLKNESSLRSTIDTWSNHDSVELLVMVVDMSNQVSTERVNFLRCCVDQIVSEKRKIFIAILHYPVSAFSANNFYPALFLDNWKHIYLDSIGDKEGLSGDMKKLVRKTCHISKDERFDIGRMTQKIMDEAIKSAVNLSIIYSEQLPPNLLENAAIFHARCEFLSSVLSTNIEETTIKDHLTRRFIDIWTDENLAKVLRRATWSLQNGISQLGLTSCLKSIMQDVMGTFMLHFLSWSNEWKNFDLLNSSRRRTETDHLFFSILSSLPNIPFEELLLHKSDSIKKRKQLPHSQDLDAKFPFFSLINTLLDELIESAFQNIAQDGNASSILVACSTSQLLQRAMNLLEERSDETFGGIALQTVIHVNNVEVLYLSYLEQFISWILSSSPTSSTAQWFRDKLYTESLSSPANKRNLLLIHITARKYETELMRLSSFCHQVPLWDEAMDTMQKLRQDKNLMKEFNGDTSFAFDGTGLIEATTEWFVTQLDELRVGDATCRWMELFPMFKHTMSDMLGDQAVTNVQVVRCLRLLSFFYILKTNASSPQDLDVCIKSVYDLENSVFLPDTDTTMVAFIKLFDTTLQSEERKIQCTKDMLHQFFSPQWLSKIGMFWEDDLNFMMKYLVEVGDELLLLKLTRNACTYGTIPTSPHSNGKDQIYDKVLNLSISRLRVIEYSLHCTDLSVFSEDGSRRRIPHFIPQFAKSSEHYYAVKDSPEADKDEEINLFFKDYDSTFSGILPEVVFQIVLEKIITLSEGQTSDKLLLALLKDIHDECNLTRQEQTRCRRTCTHSHSGSNSHTGSALSVMIIESRLLCFMLRVAYEMANGLPVPALEGGYSKKGKVMLKNIMSIPNTRWQEIFMLHIIHMSGEARLRSLLSDGSLLLGALDWTEEWRGGLPMIKDGIEEKLDKAERALREAEAEELKKSTEMRLCPHCRQPFLLLAANCGQFVCGRADTHTSPINGPLGCGGNFRLSDTQYYNVDETRLAPLRNAVADEKKKLQEHQTMSRVWDWMWRAELPYLSSVMTNVHNHFMPLSIAVSTIGKDSDIVRHVVDSKEKASTFQMLPQLIELYAWLHSTFGSIISQEQASSILIGDIMNKEILSKRFDSIHVEHLIFVWETVRDSLNNHLMCCDYKINWNCETLEVPFEKIEDASLIMLLSAFQHPADGYDYLFIIINQIIGQFNEFMRKLHADQQKTLESLSIQPRSLLSRSPAGLSLKALGFISSSDLQVMVDSFRFRHKDEYDVAGLEKAILDELSRCQFIIANPLSYLRNQFRFREDNSLQTIDASKAGLKSSVGTYFVHHQDLQLFEDCQRILKEAGLDPQGTELKQTFMAKFHQLGYDELRGILAGVTNALNTFSFTTNQTLAGHISTKCSLLDLGFPQLSESQAQLILSLQPRQITEFIHHVGYQLASEAYNFIMLPMSMNSNIPCVDRDKLRENIKQLVNRNGKEDVLKCLNEFRNDILYLYQLQIRDHCASSNDGIKHFLEVSNFCDDSDEIFAALPDNVTVRNYIPLQQELHQLTLQMMTEENVLHTKKESVMPGMDLEFAKSRRGKCWLFQPVDSSDDDDPIFSDDEDLSMSPPRCAGDKLWFESSIMQKGKNASMSDDEGISTSTGGNHSFGTSTNSLENAGIDDGEDMSIESTMHKNHRSKNNFERMNIDDDEDISTSSEAYHINHTGSRDFVEKIPMHVAASISEIQNDHERALVGDDTAKYLYNCSPFDRETKPPQAMSSLPFPTPTPKPPLSEEQIELKAEAIRAEFMQQPNQEHLLLKISELKEHPGAVSEIVETYVDAALSCEEDERAAIITIISTLFTNGIITSDDIRELLGDTIEFIEEDIMDSPRAVEYMGDLIAEFLHIKALDVTWLCVQVQKLEEFSAHLIPKIIEQSISSLINRFNLEEAKVHFATASVKLTLAGLLGGKEKWNEITRTTGLS